MRAGSLYKAIMLMRLVQQNDTYGADTSTYESYANCRAQWSPQTARETIQAGKEDYIELGVVRIRWRDDIKSTDRFMLDGRQHKIESLIEIQRHKGWEILYSVIKERP
jgi:SPP1 family predicted phage head-tail adaptor